jgi:hypothetical protein
VRPYGEGIVVKKHEEPDRHVAAYGLRWASRSARHPRCSLGSGSWAAGSRGGAATAPGGASLGSAAGAARHAVSFINRKTASHVMRPLRMLHRPEWTIEQAVDALSATLSQIRHGWEWYGCL